MSNLQIIGTFRVDEDIEVETGIEPNPKAKEIRLVFVNVNNAGQTIVVDSKIPDDLSAGETAQRFRAKGQVHGHAKPGTYQWMELVVTDDDGNQYNEWGDETAVDDPHITRAIRILPKSENQRIRPPLPPFTEDTAREKVQKAQDAWNTRDPEKVAGAYTVDSKWRNRDEFFEGREAIVEFLTRKWERELEYRLMKELWAYASNHISVRFEYESCDASGQWWRSHGNEHWEFDDEGYMRRRDASINDYEIEESERRIF